MLTGLTYNGATLASSVNGCVTIYGNNGREADVNGSVEMGRCRILVIISQPERLLL